MLRPLLDKVIIEPIKDADITQLSSGLFVFKDAKTEKAKNVLIGRVIAKGPGLVDTSPAGVPHLQEGQGLKYLLAPADVKEGDLVAYHVYASFPFQWEDREYVLISARDVWAVVPDKEV